MFRYITVTVFILTSIIAKTNQYQAQPVLQPYVGKVTPLQEAECRKEVGITLKELDTLYKASIHCFDAFEYDKLARCYHRCLKKKLGYYNADDSVNMARVGMKYSQLNPEAVKIIDKTCSDTVKTKDKCDWAYAMHKCFDKVIGDYPHGTKQLPTDPIKPKWDRACKKEAKITDEELCKANSGMDHDRYEDSKPARCYQTCLLEKLKFVKGNKINYKLVKKRYDYIDSVSFDLLIKKCDRKFNKDTKCDVVYQIHKCFKSGIKEYPVRSDEMV